MTDAPVPRPPSFPREFFSGAADFAHFRIRYGGRLGEPRGGRGARAEARGAGAGAARRGGCAGRGLRGGAGSSGCLHGLKVTTKPRRVKWFLSCQTGRKNGRSQTILCRLLYQGFSFWLIKAKCRKTYLVAVNYAKTTMECFFNGTMHLTYQIGGVHAERWGCLVMLGDRYQ